MTPVVELIVAILVLLELQLPPETVELKVVVLPTHISWSPLKVPANVGVLTVTVLVAVALEQPPEPAIV